MNYFRTTESVCFFLDSICLGTVKVKLSEEDMSGIRKLIGRENAIESFKNKSKSNKMNEKNIKKAEIDNLGQIFKMYPLFASWPQVLKRILLV